MNYRSDIDTLRALAIVLVMMFHGQTDFFPGGFLGVDVFFVISGFIITSIILVQLERNVFKLGNFYGSRIRRIFPALFIMVLFVAVFCVFFPVYLENDFGVLRRSMRSALFFYSNIYFCFSTGYFDTAAINQVFLHTWSLSVEAQFYLAYPLFVLFFIKNSNLT